MNRKINDELITTKESFLVVLDSRNATGYNNGDWNSDITFDLNDAIRMSKDAIHMSMVVSAFTCPVSFYQINITNNILNMTLNNVITNFNIPFGNYNSTTFISYLTSILPSDFTITINTITNIITFKSISTTYKINSNSTIYNILGFKKNTQYIPTNFILVMPYTCNFAGLNSFNIVVENIHTKNIDSRDLSVSSIVASIPINASQNGVIYYEKRNDFEIPIKESTIDYFDINIKDDLGNLINFNNQSWNLVLQFNIVSDVKRFNYTFHEELTNAFYNNKNL